MKTLNNLFDDLAAVDEIVENSEKVLESALALSQDGAKAVVVLCLALAKACADAKVPAQLMMDSVLEMEETYLLEGNDELKSDLDSN